MKKILFVLFTLLIYSGANAQEQIVRELQETARTQMNNGNFRGAFQNYEKLLAIDENNPVFNYEMGICVFKGSVDKSRALPYFEKSFENKNDETPNELFYYLGKTYHYQSNFLFAISSYTTCLAFLTTTKAGDDLRNDIETLIDQAEQGKNLVEGQNVAVLDQSSSRDEYKYFVDGNRYVKIVNLSDKLNSEYSDYAPLFIGDNNTLVFTSRREGTTGGDMYYDDQYYEDIYVAFFNDSGEVEEVVNLNQSDVFDFQLKNTSKHDATVSMSNDESMVFIYHNNHIMELVKDEAGAWKKPVELSEEVANQTNQVTAATISNDKNTLFLVSNRSNDTKGGRDIYYSTKNENGVWSKMENIGAPINTEDDESSPYMPNDTTLYFSSKGHSSIGGYDVFVSHKRNGAWTEPENLNMPINTPFDEINYRISNDRTFAYYSSDRSEGYGKFDIYKISKGFDVTVDENVLATFQDINEDSLPTEAFLSEKALAYENSANQKNTTTVNLVEQEGGATIGKGGEKDLANLTNDESLKVEKTGSNTISVTEKFDDSPINISDLNQKALENSINFNIPNKVQYRDDYSNSFIFEKVAHFGFNSVVLTEYSKKVIQPVIDFTKDNPGKKFTIRLYGHTDTKGSPKQNMIVSANRAQNVKAYLEQQGISANIETKSFGESRPAISTENDENSVFNRRVQVRVYVN